MRRMIFIFKLLKSMKRIIFYSELGLLNVLIYCNILLIKFEWNFSFAEGNYLKKITENYILCKDILNYSFCDLYKLA